MDAQQQQEEALERNIRAARNLSPSLLKQELEVSRKRNAGLSSTEKSSLPTDLVDQVMKRHGLSRSEAESELRKNGA